MWVQRIIILLLLQRVLGLTLSRHEPQETEVYELKTDKETNSVQFVYPKSSVPKLREIIYYHIIEKPYPNTSEETTTAEAVEPESETERLPTNTHGYQFLDNLLVDYDTATESSTNLPEEQDYVYDEDGNVYLVPAEDVQYEDNPAETYQPAEEPAENAVQEVNYEAEDEAEPEETIETEDTVEPEATEKETSSDDTNEDFEVLVPDDAESNPDLTESESDLTETDADLNLTELDDTQSISDLTQSVEDIAEDKTADDVIETTEPMTAEAAEVPKEEELEVEDIVKKLEARNQLYGNADQMRERLLKIRSYMPHLHPMNSQFEPEVVSSKRRRRRRRSVNAKRISRRRREILYIYPQGRSLNAPYDESDIPVAPTLSPMDTEGLPDFIRSELKPEHDESNAETPESVPEESGFVPPDNTYGINLDNGNGYVWNTLYGSASSEPSYGEETYTTPYPALSEETPDITELEATYGDIPEESIAEEETVAYEETPSEIPEENVDIPEEAAGSETQEDYNAEEPNNEAEETPAYEATEELPGYDENVEESLPEEIEEGTELPADIASDDVTTENFKEDMEQRLLDIFESFRDIEKQVDSTDIDNAAVIESKIQEYLEAEKDLLLEPVVVEDKEIEKEVDEQEADTEEEELLKNGDDVNNDDDDDNGDDIAPESELEEVPIVPEQHGSYGFRLTGGQGEVWNDLTGVRYHVGNDEASFDNFDNLDPVYNDINKPVDNAETILEPFDETNEKNFELDNSDKTPDDDESHKTPEDKINVIIDEVNDVSSKNYIVDILGNIFKDLKNLTNATNDYQLSTALPDLPESLESSPFLALLEDDKYRDWVREWTIEYTRFLAEYINDSVQAAIAKKELELLKKEGPIAEDNKARLYINDQELTQSAEVDTIINTISNKYLRRRRKHCKKPESTEITAENDSGLNHGGNTVNVFVFFTEEQGEKILDLIKPDTIDEGIDSEFLDTSDEEYKPDELEIQEAEEEGIEIGTDSNTQEPISETTSSQIYVFEPVDETTEPSADDSEIDTLPVDNPDLVREPEVVEEPADESIPEESEDEIEEGTSSNTDDVLDEPEETIIEAGDEEPVVITELPEAGLEEEERGDVYSEPEILAEEAVEEADEDIEPVGEEEVDDTEAVKEEVPEPIEEPVQEEEEIAEPVEEVEDVPEPVEEVEELPEVIEPIAEDQEVPEPVEEEEVAAEPVEEEEELPELVEPIAEEEEASEAGQEEEVPEPVAAEVEVLEPVVEEEEAAEPVAEEEEVIEPTEDEQEIPEEVAAEPVQEEEELPELMEPVAEEEEAAEPAQEEEELSKSVEERNEVIEPGQEEEVIEPVAEEEEAAEPVAEKKEAAEPVAEEEEAVEPVEEEEEVPEPLVEEEPVVVEEDVPEPVEEGEVTEQAEESEKDVDAV